MKIIVTGATGLVGAEVVRQAITDDDIHEIIALVRKPLDFQHSKIRTLILKDFLDYSQLENVIKEQNACVWCLGISQSQVSKSEYFKITYEYTMKAAEAMLRFNPNITFMFLSGMGADSTEKSRTIFARVKGQTENALIKMPFKKLYIIRPGGIKPIHKNPNTAFTNKLMIPFFPLMKLLTPDMVISSVQLAKAMLYMVKNGSDNIISENKELLRIAGVLKIG